MKNLPKYIQARLTKVYRDSDGWWAHYKPGWGSGFNRGAHGEHEQTRKVLLEQLRGSVPCDCDDCKRLVGR